MKPDTFFLEEEKQAIINAIKEAELNTSGEIRVHLEGNCKEDVMDRAAFIFEKLKMHATEKRNGVLFYLSVNDNKFAILGDAGINAVTPDDFWNDIKELVLAAFKKGDFVTGLTKGILFAGDALKNKFPYKSDDVNELSDEISFGKN
jgi:uncharacterized membrane protein